MDGPGTFNGDEYSIDTDTAAGDFFVKYSYTDGEYIDSSHFVIKILSDDMAQPIVDVDKTYIKDGEDLIVRIYDPFETHVEFFVDGTSYVAEYEANGWWKKNLTPFVIVNQDIEVTYLTETKIVKGYALTANFDTESDEYCSLYEIEFENSSFGDNATYVWDFDDGSTSYEKEPKHTYLVSGAYSEVYDVKLKIRDDEGNSVTHTKTLTINGSTSYDCFQLDYLNFYVKEDGTLVFSNDYENLDICLYSVEGKLVRDITIDTKNREYKINSNGIAEGLYSIRVSNGKEIKSHKILF